MEWAVAELVAHVKLGSVLDQGVGQAEVHPDGGCVQRTRKYASSAYVDIGPAMDQRDSAVVVLLSDCYAQSRAAIFSVLGVDVHIVC